MQIKIKKGFRLEVPEWAIDSHTESGRKLIKEKNIDLNEQFYKNGAILNKEKILIEGNVYKNKLFHELGINEKVSE